MGGQKGQTFWILDRAQNHREVARYRTGGFAGEDTTRTMAVAQHRCDLLNQQARR
jgi:hypothetical protein